MPYEKKSILDTSRSPSHVRKALTPMSLPIVMDRNMFKKPIYRRHYYLEWTTRMNWIWRTLYHRWIEGRLRKTSVSDCRQTRTKEVHRRCFRIEQIDWIGSSIRQSTTAKPRENHLERETWVTRRTFFRTCIVSTFPLQKIKMNHWMEGQYQRRATEQSFRR